MSQEATPNAPADPPTPRPILPVPDAEAKLRAIAEKQGTLGTSTFEKLLGSGKHLWESDEDFERFMEILREARARG